MGSQPCHDVVQGSGIIDIHDLTAGVVEHGDTLMLAAVEAKLGRPGDIWKTPPGKTDVPAKPTNSFDLEVMGRAQPNCSGEPSRTAQESQAELLRRAKPNCSAGEQIYPGKIRLSNLPG